jgi:hypothetical protein
VGEFSAGWGALDGVGSFRRGGELWTSGQAASLRAPLSAEGSLLCWSPRREGVAFDVVGELSEPSYRPWWKAIAFS